MKIDEDLAESVNAAAAASGVPVETFVRELLANHLSAAVEW